MSETVASQLLRAGLLEGASVLIAGAEAPEPGEDSLGAASAAACAELGASVSVCSVTRGDPAEAEDSTVERTVEGALAGSGGVELLVIDDAELFAAAATGPAPGREHRAAALRSCLDVTWSATRAVVNGAFIPGGQGGRIIYLSPAPGAGEHAHAARAGLENLARTLSVEWARHAITAVAIAPGEATASAEVAALVAYLASPAGAYFSGCLLDLTG